MSNIIKLNKDIIEEWLQSFDEIIPNTKLEVKVQVQLLLENLENNLSYISKLAELWFITKWVSRENKHLLINFVFDTKMPEIFIKEQISKKKVGEFKEKLLEKIIISPKS